MIHGLVVAVEERVVDPQASEDLAPEVRALKDAHLAELKTFAASLSVVPLSTTPVRPEVGDTAGVGVLVSLQHVIVVTLQVQRSTVERAMFDRDAIVADLLRRAVPLEWENVVIDGPTEQHITRVRWALEYPREDDTTLAAYASLVFTFDTEWRL